MISAGVHADELASKSFAGKDDLEAMFASLVKRDQFGYTLLGLKPVALSGYFIKEPWTNILLGISPSGVFWSQWKQWKRFSTHFNFPNFIFLEEPFASCPEISFIFLIHKPSFKNAIIKHRGIFEGVLGSDLDENKILNALESRTTTLQASLKYNEMLLGILLGFGEESSRLYAQRQEISGPVPVPFALREKPSLGFQSVEEELQHIENQLVIREDVQEMLCDLQPLQFASPKDSLEAKQIRRLFQSHRLKVMEFFREKLYLDVSLHLLMNESQPFDTKSKNFGRDF